jgi:metal-responsive CopG/Arc/MetJ family transcriptional regulator
MMKTVQIRLEEDLVVSVDRVIKKLGVTRSAFARDALRSALEKVRRTDLEQKHREGYARKPVQKGEFDLWENEQVWEEE